MTLPTIVRMRSYRDYPLPNTVAPIWARSFDWRAPPGKVYVALILGTEPQDGSDPLPIVKMLQALVIDGQRVMPERANPQVQENRPA